MRISVKVIWKDCLNFVDSHPRTGWYLCIVVTLNMLLQLLDLIVV